MLKKTQAFKTLLCLHGNWDDQSSKGNRKVVYLTVPLPMKITRSIYMKILIEIKTRSI